MKKYKVCFVDGSNKIIEADKQEITDNGLLVYKLNGVTLIVCVLSSVTYWEEYDPKSIQARQL